MGCARNAEFAARPLWGPQAPAVCFATPHPLTMSVSVLFETSTGPKQSVRQGLSSCGGYRRAQAPPSRAPPPTTSRLCCTCTSDTPSAWITAPCCYVAMRAASTGAYGPAVFVRISQAVRALVATVNGGTVAARRGNPEGAPVNRRYSEILLNLDTILQQAAQVLVAGRR